MTTMRESRSVDELKRHVRTSLRALGTLKYVGNIAKVHHRSQMKGKCSGVPVLKHATR